MSILQVIQPAPRQNCSRCHHIVKCRWRRTPRGNPLSDRNDTINLLVCRIKMDINKNMSTKSLLQLFRPGMVNLVSHAKKRSGSARVDFDDMLMEMQSFAIESIIKKYRIGELNPITNFLFDPKSGYLTKWAKWYVTKAMRFDVRHQLMGASPYGDDNGTDDYLDSMYDGGDEDGTPRHTVTGALRESIDESYTETYANEDTRTMAQEVMEIIDDGVTLNANEYRVLKFCLQNANEGNEIRMVDGLHINMARSMGVSRPRVTRLYKRGRDKLIVACAHLKKEFMNG
jgi:hypothetical protein